jgi:hypothetical protein
MTVPVGLPLALVHPKNTIFPICPTMIGDIQSSAPSMHRRDHQAAVINANVEARIGVSAREILCIRHDCAVAWPSLALVHPKKALFSPSVTNNDR